MSGEPGTEWLRGSASAWSLAGDQRLLSALHHIHQKVMCGCGETRSRLDAMTAALDEAALALHNVNNKLMCVSSSQFVERRVYDDDDVIHNPPPHNDNQVSKEAEDEVSLLGLGIETLERYHEPLSIPLDSDSESDSDSDNEARLVLRPIDLYASRPLPHVIGTNHFNDKWHAGLLPSESETESGSEAGQRDTDEAQYSDDAAQPQRPVHTATPASSSSVSPHWSGSESPVSRRASTPRHDMRHDMRHDARHATPAQVAAQLASKLAGDALHVAPVQSPPEEPAAPKHRPLYTARTIVPQAGVVFPTEPPPLEDLDHRSLSSEDQDDIFAELHSPAHSQPYHVQRKDHNAVAQRDGFDEGDLSDDVAAVPDVTTSPTPTSHAAALSKKPVGGVSVFGKQAAESIGAAVMRRRQRQDGDREHSESDSDAAPVQRRVGANSVAIKQNETEEDKTEVKREKDIFDELFAKSEKIQQKPTPKTIKETKVEKKETKKIDLFDDSIFDDIDDIFSSNNTKVSDKHDKKRKSIFDDDDDDLFAEVAVKPKVNEIKNKVEEKTRGKTENKTVKTKIFDSDDDLFSEPVKPLDKSSVTKKPEIKTSESKTTSGNLFDKLLDADDVLFKDTKIENDNLETKTVTNNITKVKPTVTKSKPSSTLFNDLDDDDLFSVKPKDHAIQNEFKTESAKQNIKKRPDATQRNQNINNQETLTNHGYEIKVINDAKTMKFQGNSDELTVKVDEPVKVIAETDNFTTSTKPNKIEISDKTDDSLFNKISHAEGILKANEENKIDKKDFNATHPKVDVLFTDTNDDDLFLNVNTNEKDKLSISSDQQTFDNSQDGLFKVSVEESVSTTQKSKSFISSPDIFEDDIDELFVNSSKEHNKIIVENDMSTNATLKVIDRDDNVKSKIDNTHKDKEIDKAKNISSKESVTEELDKNIFINSEERLNQLEPSNKSEDMISKSLSTPESNTDVTNAICVNKEESDTFMETNTHPNILKETKIINVNSEDYTSNIFEEKIEIIANTKIDSESQNEDDIRHSNENKTLPESPKPDIFATIFDDQPPVFEKPKEPKKSKNVNALFDDDSDDETLFFKKNETILDENPEEFSSKLNSNLFGIFHEEPPAIDVDFVKDFDNKSESSKLPKTQDVPPDIITTTLNKPDVFSKDDFDDLLIPKTESVIKEQNHSKSDIKSNFSIKPETKNREVVAKPTEIVKRYSESSETSEVRSPDKTDGFQNVEPKKIGKLKPMNLNINVNTLLPGASPKKTQKIEQTDGNTISTKSDEEINTVKTIDTNNDSKLVKSVSFEGEPESPPLDNKLSKERAKIQVKRRPSTRRARREAVKKSGIDFGEDSTDNSSSLDDHTKSKDVRSENMEDKSDKVVDVESGPPSLVFDLNENSEDKDVMKEKGKSIVSNVEGISNDVQEIQSEKIEDLKQFSSHSTSSRDVKSKIVYILNDEDIFSSPKVTPNNANEVKDPLVAKPPESGKKSKVLNIVDDDDDILKTAPLDKTESLADVLDTQSITTLGKVYKNENKTVQKKEISILDLLDEDDDLFKGSTKTENKTKQSESMVNKTESKSQIVTDKVETKAEKESSNGKDIFTADAKITEAAKTRKSLFDDLSDDEDLFSSKLTQSKAVKKSALFPSDSDEELFSGIKNKKESSTASTSATRTTDGKHERQQEKENTKMESKRVTSIFGDDDDDDDELFGRSTRGVTNKHT